MLKFLRKYRKILLGGFVVILMVAFVAPQLLQQLGPSPEDRKIGTLDGRTVTSGELTRAAAEISALSSLNPYLPQMIGIEQGHLGEHWLLLKHEAERAGLVGEAGDGREWIPEIATQTVRLELVSQFGGFAQYLLQQPEYQQRMMVIAQQMSESAPSVAARAGLTEDQLLKALSTARGVIRLKEAYFLAARPSPAQMAMVGRRLGDRATVNYLFVPGSTLASEVPDPSEDELRAHFERFADVEPGTGEFGIGYKRPARVKVEWLAVEKAAIANAIPVDRVELRKMYESNRATYTGEYEAERERVRTDYLETRTADIMTEIGRVVRAEVLKATRRLENDGGFKVLPPDWESTRPTLDAIARTVVDTIRQTKGVEIPLPRVEVRDTAWLDAEGVQALPGIGGAVVRVGNNQLPFARYAFEARELGGNPALTLQAGLTEIDTQTTDQAGNQYYFTIREARPPARPDSMQEVPTLVADYKAVKGYEKLLAELPVYEQLARTDSLEAVGAMIAGDGGVPLLPQVGVPLSRSAVQGIDPTVNTEPFRNAVMDAALKLNPDATPEELAAAPESTVSVAMPEKLGVAIAKIKAVEPFTLEQFRRVASQLALEASAMEAAELIEQLASSDPFKYDTMARRHAYVMAGRDDDDTPAATSAENGTQAAEPVGS